MDVAEEGFCVCTSVDDGDNEFVVVVRILGVAAVCIVEPNEKVVDSDAG